jgi:hypothetical protein
VPVDLHEGRLDPRRYRALVFSGHDEYWSAPMRSAAEAAVAGGTHLAFVAANNCYWHVRFERSNRVMVCYKTDPDPQPDASGPTTKWRSVSLSSRAEQGLIGVQYTGGMVRHACPLVVRSADHWFWTGTWVAEGTEIPGLVGGEADGKMSDMPSPSGVQTLLSHSPFQLAKGPISTQNTSLGLTPSGAWVFAAGTLNWPRALGHPIDCDPRIMRATASLFQRLRWRP